MPLVVCGPGVTPGLAVSEPVGLVDLVPTVLELARLPAPATLDGGSLAPLLAGQSQGREWVLTENDHEMGFVLHLRTLTTTRHVLTRYDTMPGVGELYDRALDPGRAREPLGRPGIRGNQARPPRAARRGREPFAPSPAEHGLARVTALVGIGAAQ